MIREAVPGTENRRIWGSQDLVTYLNGVITNRHPALTTSNISYFLTLKTHSLIDTGKIRLYLLEKRTKIYDIF